MLAVILKILSVTGIVLLCLLGLVLVLAVLILVLPVKYRLKASKEKEGELNAVFKLNYFFHILRSVAEYEQKKVNVTVKVLWFKLFSMEFPDSGDESDISEEDFDAFIDEELSDEEFEMTDSPEQGDESAPDSGSEADSGESCETPESAVSDEELHNDLFGDDEDDLYGSDADNASSDGEDSEDNGPDGTACEGGASYGSGTEDGDSDGSDAVSDAPDGLFDKLSGLMEKIKCKYRAFYDKIVKVRSEIRYYRNILNSNEAAYALRVIKKRLKKVLKLILPRKVTCDLVYGFSSPDLTGKVYGLYCMFRNRFSKGSKVIPDFENEVFEGFIEAKGHFNLICILHNLVCIVLNRNCRKIYRSLKHHRNKSDHEAGTKKDEKPSEEEAA